MTDPLLASLAEDSQRLVDAVRDSFHAEVPTCPGWTAERLLSHTGRVHRWVTAVVAGDLDAGEAAVRPDLPEAGGDLAAWFVEGAHALHDTLSAADAHEPRWTWVHGPRGSGGTVGWWRRRMAIETVVHRADAELASGRRPTTPDEAVGAAGIEEMLGGIVPTRGFGSLRGSLHLHSTDGDGEWLATFADDGMTLTREHAKGDAAIRGAAGDLCLFLWNRLPPSEFEIFGNAAMVADWSTQVQF